MGKPAARVSDQHLCPLFDGPKPHVGGPILPPGTATVLIGGLPAATVGSPCLCVSPVPDSIVLGSPTVLIGGVPAARLFDPTLLHTAGMTGSVTKMGSPAQTELPTNNLSPNPRGPTLPACAAAATFRTCCGSSSS